MIVRRNLQFTKILPYVWRELVFAAIVSVAAPPFLALPFAPLALLGTALAFFLGFRGNTGYARWWEARNAWGGVANGCRIVARIVITSTESAARAGKVRPERAAAFSREVVLRQAAFAHALRMRLRNQPAPAVLASLLPEGEAARLAAAADQPALILQYQSLALKDAFREDLFGTFDPIALERNLAALQEWQGACDRIRSTPVPAQYGYFTRAFLWIFLALLAPSLVSLFPTNTALWATPPLTLVLAFVFAAAAKVGEVCDDPFSPGPHDIPMTAICTDIERSLREMLGDTSLPAPAAPLDGYLH